MIEHSASPELRRLIAFQHIAIKEQVWLGDYEAAVRLSKYRLKKCDMFYRIELETLNAAILAVASQDPARIQESLNQPSRELAKRNPKTDIRLMNWAFLHLECGDSDLAQQFLENWPRQRETIFWGTELTREFLLTKIYLKNRDWVKAHIACRRAEALFDVVDSFRSSIAYFHVELVPGVRPAFANLINEFQKSRSQTVDSVSESDENQVDKILELSWQPDLSSELSFESFMVSEAVSRYDDLAKIPAYEKPNVLSADEALKELMAWELTNSDSKNRSNPFLQFLDSDNLASDKRSSLEPESAPSDGQHSDQTGRRYQWDPRQGREFADELTQRVYALPLKKQAFLEFCWSRVFLACIELCLQELNLELKDEFSIEHALRVVDEPNLLDDHEFLKQLSKDAFGLLECEEAYERAQTRFSGLLMNLNRSICKGVELLTGHHEFDDRDFWRPSYIWCSVYEIYYYLVGMKAKPEVPINNFAMPNIRLLVPKALSHPGFLATWKVVDELLHQLEGDCPLSEIDVPTIKKSHFMNLN